MKDFSSYQTGGSDLINEGDRIAQMLRDANQQTQPMPMRPQLSGIFSSIAHAADTQKGPYDAYNDAYSSGLKEQRQALSDQVGREAKVYDYLSKAKDLGDTDRGKIKDNLDLLVGQDPVKQQQVIAHVLDKYPDQQWDSSNSLRPIIEAMTDLGMDNNAAYQQNLKNREKEADIGVKEAKASSLKNQPSGVGSGLPADYQNLPPKLAQTRYSSDLKTAQKMITDASDESNKSFTELSLLDRINKDSEDAPAAPFADSKQWTAELLSGASGKMKKMAKAGQDLRSASQQLTASVHGKGEGSISNYERTLFENVVPSLNKTVEGRATIGEAMKALAERRIEYEKFLNEWAKTHAGLTNGAKVVWDRYAEENPVIMKSQKEGMVVTKPARSWRDYMNAAQTPAIGGVKNPPAAGSPQAQIDNIAAGMQQSQGGIPKGAIQELIDSSDDPTAIKEFNEMFGEGSAEAILQQGGM